MCGFGSFAVPQPSCNGIGATRGGSVAGKLSFKMAVFQDYQPYRVPGHFPVALGMMCACRFGQFIEANKCRRAPL
jgi:hypothetical protein